MEGPLRHPFILPIIILLGASGIVTPLVSMQLLDGMLGHLVDFTIPVPLPSKYRMDWNYGHAGKVTVIARLTAGGSPQYNPQYKERCELFLNGTLRLNSISYADDGTYKVKVFNPDTFTSYVQRYQLTTYAILSTPVLTSNSPLIIGTNATLHCDAGNQIVTTYTFYHDQKPICSEPHVTCRASFLDYKPIAENDNGPYTCSIQNPVSTSTSNSIIVTVAVPVSSVILISNTSGLLWPGLYSVSLHCSAHGTNASYSWSMDDKPLPEEPQYHLSQNASTLIINPVSSNDTGTLRCRASNWVNKETSNKLNLNLASPVSAVMLSNGTSRVLLAGKSSVSLHCSAQGSSITFSWRLNGKPVSSKPPYNITQSDSPQNSTLTISPVSKKHTGPFTCSASNLVNSKTSNKLNLSIKWHPKGSIVCAAHPHDSLVQLDCSWLGGQPPANVTMIFNNIEDKGQNEVTRNVPLGQITKRSNLTCLGEHLGKTSACSLIFRTPQLPQDINNATTAVMQEEKANQKTKALP